MHSPILAHSQNFLHSPALVSRLIKLTSIAPGDLVIEIGPGRGIITKQLATIGCQVIAVEYDSNLYRLLKNTFSNNPNVTIHHSDFRTYVLPSTDYRILANIPFNITSDILSHITDAPHAPVDAYLLMQEEAARKYAGQPYRAESLKSLLLKPRFESTLQYRFAETDFVPIPQVRAVLLHFHRRTIPLLNACDYQRYRDFLCYIFSQSGRDVGERLQSIFTYTQLKRLAREMGFSLGSQMINLLSKQWLGLFAYYRIGVSLEKQRLVDGAEGKLYWQQQGLRKIHRNRSPNAHAIR
jgi:23S rRNA (adenine-N6)-dimethyltransferase